MSYRVILFDLDDTLIDFAYSERMGLRKVHEQFYKMVAYPVFERLYKEINTNLWQQVSAQENPLMPSDVRVLRFIQLNERLSCKASVADIANEYDRNLCIHAHWLPGVQAAIEFLYQKGHILGIITNGFINVQGEKQQRLRLNNWFDCYIVSDEVSVSKPNAEIFNIALSEIAHKRQQAVHSFPKQSMLMVGDSIISDGYGAQNFGIDYCFINNKSLDLLPSSLPIAHNISSVAYLPASIGYEAEYKHFLLLENAVES
jgi:2-haloacid dehalogenase